MRKIIAAVTLTTLVTMLGASASGQGANGLIDGSANRAAKTPYPDYQVRARVVETGVAVASARLNADGQFRFTNLPPNRYLLELLDAGAKVVCSEGPFRLALPDAMSRRGVEFSCSRTPAALWLLGAAAAAGLSAGVTAIRDPASPSR